MTLPTTAPITLSGAYLTYFEDSSVGQGQPETVTGYPNCEDLHTIINNAPHIRVGTHGYYIKINATADHLTCIAEQADMMLECVNWGDDDPTWRSAANTLLKRVKAARHYLTTGEHPTTPTPTRTTSPARGANIGDTLHKQRGRTIIRRYQGTLTALTHDTTCPHCQTALKTAINNMGKYRDTSCVGEHYDPDHNLHKAKIRDIRPT